MLQWPQIEKTVVRMRDRKPAFVLQQEPYNAGGDLEGRQNLLPVSSGTLIRHAAAGAKSPAHTHPRQGGGHRNKEETHAPLT